MKSEFGGDRLTIVLIVLVLLFSGAGFTLGAAERHHIQSDYCPKCSCREECNIGCSVKGKHPENECTPMACTMR